MFLSRPPRVPAWALVALCFALVSCAAEPAENTDDSADIATDTGNKPEDTASIATDVAKTPKDTGSAAVDVATNDVVPADVATVDVPAAGPPKLCTSNAQCTLGNPCLGEGYCRKDKDAWVCAVKPNTAVVCPSNSDTPCAVNTCDPKTGACAMTATADGTPCTDLDPCVVKSACKTGKCVAGSATWCQCKKSADCLAIPNHDPCLGQWFCDKATFPFTCRVSPNTSVKCAKDKDTACVKNGCDATTGKCAMTNVQDGEKCSDGDPQTVSDACHKGVCKGGTLVSLCEKDTDCDVHEDGNVCNGTLFCDKNSKSCKVNPATVITCPSAQDTSCVKNTCNKGSGVCEKKSVKNGFTCDDGDSCTAGDLCIGGKCSAGPTYTCPCKVNADCAAKDDGDLCNGTLFCNLATKKCQHQPESVVVCKSVGDTACKKNACDPKSGKCAMTVIESVDKVCDVGAVGTKQGCRYAVAKVAKTTLTLCDDGDACTAGDTCKAGVCTAGIATCPCKSHADCLAEDDGDLCNGQPTCNFKTGKCDAKVQTKPVVCPKFNDTACFANTCAKLTGTCSLQPRPIGTACDDGKPCTVKTACDAKGTCVGGAVNKCDDKNLCTKDECTVGKGCVHTKRCGDGNGCTLDACDPTNGKCSHLTKLMDGKVCNADGSGCTINDVCTAGVCKAGQVAICNEPVKACQVNACHSTGTTTFQCVVKTAADGTSCDDGDACRLGDLCVGGSCKVGKKARFGVVTLTAPGKSRTASAVHAGKGDAVFVAGLARDATESKNATANLWFVTRVGPEGDAGATRSIPHKTFNSKTEAPGLLVRADGSMVVAGAAPGNGGLDVRVVALPADAKAGVLWDKTVGAGGSEESVAELSTLPGGGFAMSGAAHGGGGGKAMLWKMTGGGAVAATIATPVGGYMQTFGHAVRFDGVAAVVGFRKNPAGGKQPFVSWIGRIDAAGKLSWTRSGLESTASHNSVVATSDGWLTTAGFFGPSGVTGMLIAYSDAGKVAWKAAMPAGHQVRGVARLGPGYVLAGDSGTNKNATGWLAGVDANGHVVWPRKPFDGVAGGLARVVVLGNGVVVAVGSKSAGATSGATDAVVVRSTAWGHVSCAAAGKCATKKAADCDDSNPCRNDLCEAGSGCVHLANTYACEDGNLCTKDEACSLGKCVGGKAATCPDGGPCADTTCAPATGCQSKPRAAGSNCDDGDVCTKGDACDKAGACKGSKAGACDDGKSCTVDSCDPKTGCQHKADAKVCDNGNVCQTGICDPKKVGAHPISGCRWVANTLPCDDGKDCTVGARCENSQCKKGVYGKLWLKELPRPLGSPSYYLDWLDAAADVGGTGSVRYVAAGATQRTSPSKLVQPRAKGLSAVGDVKWDKRFSSALSERFTAVVSLPKRAVLVGFGLAKTGAPYEAFAYAVDPQTGSKQWNFRYRDGNTSRAYAAVARHDGGVVAVGRHHHAPSKSYNGWLAFISDKGFQTKYVSIGDASNEILYAATRHGKGYAVAGVRSGAGVWVLVTDAQGKVGWQRIIPQASLVAADVIVSMKDGGIAIAGTYHPLKDQAGGFVFGLEGDGLVRWRKDLGHPYGFPGSVVLPAMVQASDGSLLVVKKPHAQPQLHRLDPKTGYSTGLKEMEYISPFAGTATEDDGLLLVGGQNFINSRDKKAVSGGAATARHGCLASTPGATPRVKGPEPAPTRAFRTARMASCAPMTPALAASASTRRR